MKDINQYILEKANFIVKKHINNEASPFEEGNYIKAEYKGNNGINVIAKVYSYNESELHFSYYIRILRDRYDVSLGGSYEPKSFDANYRLLELTDEDEKLYEEVEKYLSKHPEFVLNETNKKELDLKQIGSISSKTSKFIPKRK